MTTYIENGTEKTDTKYNGWTNYQTWNVALYIQNEESLYFAACEFMRGTGAAMKSPYLGFIRWMGVAGGKTADGVRYGDHKALDIAELDEMMRELVS